MEIRIIEFDGVEVFLQKRGLLKQYQTAKQKFLLGHFSGLDFSKHGKTHITKSQIIHQ